LAEEVMLREVNAEQADPSRAHVHGEANRHIRRVPRVMQCARVGVLDPTSSPEAYRHDGSVLKLEWKMTEDGCSA
jgi:hypothetical protein